MKNFRKAKKIGIEEFKNFIIEKYKKEDDADDESKESENNLFYGLSHFSGSNAVQNDLNKVFFDLENSEVMEIFDGNGTTFALCWGGGDWEIHPVAYVIYIDNKNKIRGYVPKEGNVYNPKFKTAYGSEGEYGPVMLQDGDEEELEKKWEEIQNRSTEWLFDVQKLKEDILNRIKAE